ncbi:hypothetical protein GUI43_05930 [Micromonospora noduli]|nr:hypothetical protein GUI43_05930 [Micromonospora noduli]
MRRMPAPTALRAADRAAVAARPAGWVNRTDPAAAFCASNVTSVLPSRTRASNTGTATP